MENKQTAVEWLEKEIYARGPIGEDTPTWLKELYEQAKQMEKEQMKIMFEKGIKFASPPDGFGYIMVKTHK